MKKQLFRLLALFLTLSILFSCIASAAPATDDEQTVYYSDLFYGYSADYLVSHYLRSYAVHTADVMLRMQEDYMNSPDSILSGFHTNLEGITDIRTTITLIGDFLGLSDFTYEQALDAANQDLFVNLFNCTASDGVRIVGEQGRFAETYGYIGDLLQEFNQQFDLSSLPATDAFQKFFSILIEEQVFVGISVSTLTDVLSELVANADKAFSFASDTYEALEAFCVALLMEDLRITMLDDILDNAVPGSTLSAGISRLKSQLSNGFVSYFYYNYVTKNLIDKIIDVLNNAIYSGTPYLLIPAILNLGRSVILDHLLQDANTAFLSIGGNLSDSVYTCWDVTAGTVTTPLLAQTIDLISAIDEEISPESAGVILRARTSYNSLHPVLRPYVTNYDKLTAAEELLNTIKEGLNAISADVKTTTKGTIPYLEATICSNGGILPALCVVFCEYGSDGQFVSSVLEPVAPLSQGETASVATPISANTKWKVFLVTASGFIPVTASIER